MMDIAERKRILAARQELHGNICRLKTNIVNLKGIIRAVRYLYGSGYFSSVDDEDKSNRLDGNSESKDKGKSVIDLCNRLRTLNALNNQSDEHDRTCAHSTLVGTNTSSTLIPLITEVLKFLMGNCEEMAIDVILYKEESDVWIHFRGQKSTISPKGFLKSSKAPAARVYNP